MQSRLNPISKNKAVGIILLTLSVFGFLIIGHRLSYYVFEYDPQYSPVDYGKYNILSYFTVQSNFFCYVYLLFAALGIFGVKKAEKIGFNPTLQALITVYILVAGITYCAGIPLGMTPPSKWDTPAHSMSSFIQIYYHIIMPIAVMILWLFPFNNKKIEKNTLWLSGIYPLVYSIFSIVRGTFSDPTYYPYPFYNPDFIRQTVSPDKNISLISAYAIMGVLLVFGISLFIEITAIIRTIHNKRIEN